MSPPTRKALALLAYLAMQPGRRASRERLAALLWPDADSAQGRLNLRKALSMLRKAATDAGGDDLLLVLGEQIELSADAIDCDVDALTAAVQAPGPPSPDVLINDLMGEFLQDFNVRDAHEFEAWARLERRRLIEQQLALLTRRLEVETASAAGGEAAVQTALRIVQIDPFQERAVRTLMTLHARQGRPAAALEQYRELAARLDRELGAMPEEDTRALYREISERRRVRHAPAKLQTTPAKDAEPPPPRPRRWPVVIGAVVVLLLLLVGGTGGVRERRLLVSDEPPELGPLVAILAGQPDATHPALSPDGSQVAHTSRRETPGNSDLYLRALAGGDPVRLTTDPAVDDKPAWSPDGRQIAFIRASATGDVPCRVVVMAPPNGYERVVGACRVAITSHLAWSGDGKAIYFVDKASPGLATGLFRLDLETGRTQVLTTSPAEIDGDDLPATSPDGKSLAFLRRNSWTSADVHVLDLARGRTTRLTVDGSRIWGLAWDRAGKGLYFSSNRGGDTGLWWVRARGGEAERISAGVLDFRSLSSAREQDLLAFEVLSDRTDLVEADPGVGRRPIAGVASPAARYSDWFPAVARDGTLAMVSDREGGERLWFQTGGHPTGVAAIPGAVISEPRWSPDSWRVVFVATRAGASDLYIADRRGGRATPLTQDAPDDASPAWTVDGKALYFTSRRGGAWRIWRINADRSGMTPVSAPGPKAVRVGADGTIYAVLDGSPGIWRIPIVDGREIGLRTRILLDQQSWDWMNWDVEGGSVFHLRRSADGLGGEVRRLTLATGRDTVVADASGLLFLAGFAVRPNGSLILTRRTIETRLMAAEVTQRP